MNKEKLYKITKAIEGEIEAFGEVMDVSKFRNLQKKLEKYLTTDAVTGILNRWKIEEVIDSEIDKTKSGKNKLCLMMIDVDKFKLINDVEGHNIGDSVLIKVAQEIEYAFEETISKSKYFGRWGGDEFVYVCSSKNAKKINKMAKNALLRMKKITYSLYIAFILFIYLRPVTVSIGVAWFRKNDGVDSIVARADKAMYRIKKKGGNGIEVIT